MSTFMHNGAGLLVDIVSINTVAFAIGLFTFFQLCWVTLYVSGAFRFQSRNLAILC